MATNMGYFRLVRSTDPSFTIRDVIEEYVMANPDAAVSIAGQMELSNAPMDYDTLEYEINQMSPMDALMLGMASEINWNDNLFMFDNDGTIYSMTDAQYRKWCIDAVVENWRSILDDGLDIPRDLEQILSMWPNGKRR